MPTEDKTAGGRAAEGRLLADLMGTRRAREVIKLHSTMASPLIKPFQSEILNPNVSFLEHGLSVSAATWKQPRNVESNRLNLFRLSQNTGT